MMSRELQGRIKKKNKPASTLFRRLLSGMMVLSLCAGAVCGITGCTSKEAGTASSDAAAAVTTATADTATTTVAADTADTTEEVATIAEESTEEAATAEEAAAITGAAASTEAAAIAAEEPEPEKTAEELAFEPFFRIDRDHPDAWQKELANVRFLTEGEYELEEFDEQDEVPEGFEPSTEGMDTLNISGSAEFSEEQFRELAEQLRELAGDKQVYIIDARQESHMLVNGISLSWYGYNNWANRGKTLAEVEAAERAVFEPLIGTSMTAYGVNGNEKTKSLDLEVTSLMTEKELVESEGFTYLRIPSPDHSWPDETSVDEFIEFVKGIDLDHTWLHFHCEAGKGRTGVYMAILDMMKNPGVPFEDIMVRQAMTGSSYLPHEREYSPMADKYKQRAQRIRQVYDYIQENRDTNYTVKWSDWIARKDAE